MSIESLLRYVAEKSACSGTEDALAEILPALAELGITPTKAIVDAMISPIDDAIENALDLCRRSDL